VGRPLNVQTEPGDDLVVALEAGNYRLAIEILVLQHGDYIYSYCRRFLGTATETEDVAQTIFTQALQSLKELSDPHLARVWLRGIARHRCLDRLRARRRDLEIIDDDELCVLADQQLSLAYAHNDPRIGRALDECLDCLDARSREVLILRFHDELPFEEISRLTSTTAGALRVRLMRALLTLRRCLESKGVRQ